jgi:hypothetical protein
MPDERATVRHSLPPVLSRGGLLSMYYRANFRVRLWNSLLRGDHLFVNCHVCCSWSCDHSHRTYHCVMSRMQILRHIPHTQCTTSLPHSMNCPNLGFASLGIPRRDLWNVSSSLVYSLGHWGGYTCSRLSICTVERLVLFEGPEEACMSRV